MPGKYDDRRHLDTIDREKRAAIMVGLFAQSESGNERLKEEKKTMIILLMSAINTREIKKRNCWKLAARSAARSGLPFKLFKMACVCNYNIMHSGETNVIDGGNTWKEIFWKTYKNLIRVGHIVARSEARQYSAAPVISLLETIKI